MRFLSKIPKIDIYTILAIIIILLSSGLRLFFITHNWPPTDSDEGTIGLMALHISQFKDFPVYLYGQGTLGSLEAYVGALLFPIFGPTVFALRFGVLLLFVLFLICIYQLASRLYSRGLALLAMVLVSLGSSKILLREYGAFAGHAETPLFGAMIVLVATLLALSSPASDALQGKFWQRLLGYSLWGYLVGASFWNDPLAAPFILTSSAFLLIFCRHELRRSILFSIIIGLLIGLLPTIIYTLIVPIDKGGFSILHFFIDTPTGQPLAYDSFFARLGAAFLVTLPVSTGATLLCPMMALNAWPLSTQSDPEVLQCTAIHGGWALCLTLIWLVAVVIAVRHLRLLWNAIPIKEATLQKRRAAILQGARLMLLGSALLTFLFYALSVQSITDPWFHHRYLIALGVATPALLWPLWQFISSRRYRSRFATLSGKFLCVALLAGYIAAMSIGTLLAQEEIPIAATNLQRNKEMTSTLLQMHITHIYTDYWTCNLTAFLTQERITCSVLDEQLHAGVNRYTPYVSAVAQDSQAAYVFLAGSPQDRTFASQIAQKGNPLSYHSTSTKNYTIYYR